LIDLGPAHADSLPFYALGLHTHYLFIYLIFLLSVRPDGPKGSGYGGRG